MTTKTLTWIGTLTTTSCWCGIGMAIPKDLYDWANRDHTRHIYCPLGHTWVFAGETEETKLKRWLKNAEDRATAIQAEKDRAEASRRAWKGQATKLRNRAAAGACPFCGESVFQLTRHVARKHPDEATRPESDEPPTE